LSICPEDHTSPSSHSFDEDGIISSVSNLAFAAIYMKLTISKIISSFLHSFIHLFIHSSIYSNIQKSKSSISWLNLTDYNLIFISDVFLSPLFYPVHPLPSFFSSLFTIHSFS
jgi:hypothetical protein